MIYDKKDVDAILDYIQKEYGMSSVYHINTDKSIAENTQEMSYQLIKAVVAFDILNICVVIGDKQSVATITLPFLSR